MTKTTKKKIQKIYQRQQALKSGTRDFWEFLQSQPQTGELAKFAKSEPMVRFLAGEKLTTAEFGIPGVDIKMQETGNALILNARNRAPEYQAVSREALNHIAHQ